MSGSDSDMNGELAAEGFLRHKGLILAAAGGAVAEVGLLALVAPGARAVAPQFTALPSLAAYHDLRWLFADTQSWLWFTVAVIGVLLVRSALDVALIRLAWPRTAGPPALSHAFASCLALTAVAWLVLSPAATLTFGVAVLPFSWPFLAAMPIVVGITAALSHGGVLAAWWRRLPPLSAVGWLLVSFLALTAAAAVIARAGTVTALLAAAAAGLVNARAWYAMAGLAARLQPRAPDSVPARLLVSLPFAPFAALMVLALVVGVVRLMFTGTIQLPGYPNGRAPAAAAVNSGQAATSGGQSGTATSGPAAKAVLVVGGWGSSCCDAADGLRAQLPGVTVRQFSYLGMDVAGRPLRSGPEADDLPLPELGDRIAAQVRVLAAQTGRQVAVVAESEGTLGVYAMLARDPGVPVSSVTLLSPIVAPGQLSYPDRPDGASASEFALNALNRLVGGMSPYGPSGAQHLLSSVSEYGARYFAAVADAVPNAGHGGAAGAAARDTGELPGRWLVVIPLADAVTLPVCDLPSDVMVVPAFHGGLLGDLRVLPMVREFLTGHSVSQPGADQLRTAAELITGASAAWRMPATGPACPG